MNTAEETQILDAIGKWLERDVRPKARELEKKDEYPDAMVEQMKQLGLFGATIPPEYGGLGLPASTYAKIVAQISEVWMSLTGIFNSHLIMAAAVARFGTEAQKKTFLPKFASGEIRGGLALTEPDAAPTCRPSAPPQDATAAAMSSTAPRPGSRTASRAIALRCW
jgi:alkylation response protein AidB-like acyl-CoA dehydrogenase